MGRKDSGGDIGTWAARVLARPEAEIEPFLIKQGFLQRTPRGRIATLAAYRHLGVTMPQAAGGGLFDV